MPNSVVKSMNLCLIDKIQKLCRNFETRSLDLGANHSAKKHITIGVISGVHWGLKERWFSLIFRVLNHILEVSKSGKVPKTKIMEKLSRFSDRKLS